MSVFRRRGHRKDGNETVCRLSRLYALGPSHFFFPLASNAFPDIGSVGRFLSMLLLCSFFILKELFEVKNGLTTSLLFFFFLENAKNLGRSDDAKRRKKEDGLRIKKIMLVSQVNSW